jgi:hypothetical protein
MKTLIVALGVLMAALSPSFAAGSSIPAPGTKDLIDRPLEYDGKIVSLTGEAIGDPMRRGDHAWVNVLDSYAAIGVFLPSGCLATIERYGSNKQKGDTLRILGVFRRACPEHGGDMDIHALDIEVAARGFATPHPADIRGVVLAPLSLAIAAALFLAWRKRAAAHSSSGAARTARR